MTQTVPDISPLMPMHQDPLLVLHIDTTSISRGIVLMWIPQDLIDD